MRFAIAALLLAGLALAGCSSTPGYGASPSPSPSPSSTPAPTATSYTVAVQGFPLTPIPANSTFTFTDHITGDAVRMSDHIGAHFGNKTSTAPSTTVYPTACVHTTGNLPGDYAVSCKAPTAPGTYYLRGHARIGPTGDQVSWWSSEIVFTVV